MIEIKSRATGEVLARIDAATLEGADFRGHDLRSADFREKTLCGAKFCGSDLRDAVFFGADLRNADFRGASWFGSTFYCLGSNADDRPDVRGARFDFEIPVIENIHTAVYQAALQPGALDMDYWHKECGTAHCRAGWVVTIAGEAGKEIEDIIGTAGAAALIYQASDPSMDRIPDFLASNEEALSDMKRLAEKGAAEMIRAIP
ncbi:MAG: pentapeptide repeat-containing protein [Pseudomonadota bacterium]